MADPAKHQMTFEEARALIAEIARNGEGADKFRALKMVMAEQASSITLPEPLNVSEVIIRLSRMMRAAGPANTQWAYREAFPRSQTAVYEGSIRVEDEDLDPDELKDLPMTLKQLYKKFPEIARPGVIPGWPAKGGPVAKVEFIRKQAILALKDRKRNRLAAMNVEAVRPAQDPRGNA